MTLPMQVERMFRFEAVISIKQNKKKGEGYIYTKKGDPAMSYNGAKTPTRKHSFRSSAINGRAKRGKKKRNCGRTDGERRKTMNI